LPKSLTIFLSAILAIVLSTCTALAQTVRTVVAIVNDQSALNLSNNFGQVGNLVVDAAGDAAFNDAQLSAVFLQKAGASTPIRLFQSGDPVPGVTGGHADYMIVRAINSSGTVAFNLVYETAGVLGTQMLVSDGVTLKQIADSAQLAVGGIIPGRSMLLNDAGDAAFALLVLEVPARLYIAPAGSAPMVVATAGTAVPGGTLQSVAPLVFPEGSRASFNNNGELLFSGTVNGNAGLYVASIKNGIRKVAAIGDQVPGGGTFTDFNLSQAAINNLGQVAFIASVTTNSVTRRAIWISDPNLGLTHEIASSAMTAPVPGGGTYSAPFAPLLSNDEGDVVFRSAIAGNPTTNAAIFRGQISGAATQVVAYSGESAPGVTGATFASFLSPASINSTGAVVFATQLSNGQNAIYSQSGANAPTLIALDGNASGDGGNFSLSGSRSRILGDNSVVFTALETAGPAFGGLFHSGTGSFQKLVNSNDPLPSGARISLRNGTISSAGSLVPFFALRAGGSVSAFVLNSLTGAITRIAGDGDSMPGIAGARLVMPAGVLFGGNIYANSGGAVALDANLATTSFTTAVLLWTSTNGLVKLIAGGDIDPVTGQTFVLPQTAATSSFDVTQSPINSQGTVLISTTLSSGQNAFYLVSAGSAPSKVIATGDSIGGLTVTDLTNGGLGTAPQLNSNGQVALNATLSDGSQGLYLKTVGATPLKIVKTGDAGPNNLGISTIPGFFSLNSSGEIAFFAGYGPLSNGVSSAGVFIGTVSNPPRSIALDGAPAPPGGNFSIQAGSCVQLCLQNLPNDVLINDEHDVAFSAALAGGASDSGYFLRRGTQGALQTVALQGQPAPGTNFNFTTFALPGGDPLDEGSPGYVFSLGPNGELAFQNEIPGQTLAAVVPDLVATFYYGLDNSLTKVVAPGDPAPGTNGGQITQTSFGPGLLANGLLAFEAATPGSATTVDAIYITENPVPVLTVTANNQSVTYGTTPPSPAYTVTPNVGLDTSPNCSVQTTTNPPTVGTYSIACTGAAKAGYAIAYASGTLTVNPAVLTVTANRLSKFWGDPVPPLTYAISGFVNGDTTTVVSGAPMLSTTATATSPVGTYPITVSQGTLSAANYTFNFVNATLQVYQAAPMASGAVTEYLYIGANDSGSLAGLSINPLSGLLAPVPGSPFPVPAPTSDVVADTLSRFLYVTSNVNGTLSAYPMDRTTGSLAPTPLFNFGLAGVSQAAEDPAGKLLYVDSNSTQQLFGFGIQASGTPFMLTGPIFQPGQIYKILIHPNGKFVYVADGAGNLLYSYLIDPGKGVPIPLPGSPLLTINGAGAAAMDPLGRFVFIAQTQVGAMITGYGIDPVSGGLFPLSWGSLIADFPAVSMAVDPRGRFLFVSRANASTATYRIDQTSGLLTPIGTAPVPGGGQGMVIDPTGNYLYTSCGTVCGGPTIAGFRIDQNSGQLDPSIGRFPAVGFNLSMATALVSFPTSTIVTASPNPVVYGQSATLTATVLSGGSPVSVGTVTFTDTTTSAVLGTVALNSSGIASLNVTTFAVGTRSVTASYSGASSIPASSGSTNLTVTPAVLTVTAISTSKFYGDPLPAFSASYSGFVNNDTTAALNGTPSLTTTATPTSPVGTYPIVAAQGTLSAANYTFMFLNGTLQVYPAPLSSAAGIKEYLYSGDLTAPLPVSGYAIDPSKGFLTSIGPAVDPYGGFTCGKFPKGAAPGGVNDLAIDPLNRFLFTANSVVFNNVSSFAIDGPSGSLTLVSGSPFCFGGSPSSYIASDPTGRFLYLDNPYTTQLSGLSVDQQTAVPSSLAGSPFALPALGAGNVAMHPNGRFLYVPNWNFTAGNSLSGYAVDPATGGLTPLPGSPFAAGPDPSAAAIDPLGRYLFVSQSTSGSGVYAFSIDQATGLLTPLSGSPFSVLQAAQSAMLLFDGFNIAAVTQQTAGPPTATTFVLTAPTQVTQIATYHYNGGAGANPGTISLKDQNGNVYGPFPAQGLNAQGQSLPPFVAWQANLNNVALPPGTYTVIDSDPSTWSYNTQSNNTGFVRVSGFTVGARGLAFDPRGRFLFVTNQSNNTTTALAIDQTTGALTVVAGSPYANGGAAVAVEATGNILYTTCGPSCGIAGFQINQTTGQLTSIGTLVPISNNIVRLAIALVSSPTGTSVNVTPNPVVYGQSATLTATVLSSGSPVSIGTVKFIDSTIGPFGTVTLNSSGQASLNTPPLSAGTHTITASYSGGGSVPSSSGSVNLTVTPAVLTVVPDGMTKPFGEVLPTLTATLTGFVNGDTAATAVTGASTLSTVVTATTPPGSYPIFAAQGTLSAANYTFAFGLGTLTVTQLSPPSLPTTPQSQITQGGAPNYTDTYATPYGISQNGFITSWQTEFSGGVLANGHPGVPAGVQLKIFRSTSSGLQVVAQGTVHDPRPALQQLLPGYPYFATSASVLTFNEQPIPVLTGDLIGITIYADPAAGAYFYPLVGPVGTFLVTRNVLIGQSINVSDPFTAMVANPPALSFTFYPASSSNPLTLLNNFFVTGDYSAAGVALRGTGIGGMATGTITIPTSAQDSTNGIPDGADIVGAYLYSLTLENTPLPSANSGTFRGYSISGQKMGNDVQYTDGNFTGTMRVYRTDVLPYFPVSNGVRVASGSHTVSLPDGGNALPLTEGAALVVVYRVTSPNFPLKAVVLYDGSAAPTNASMLQVVEGFYDAAVPGGAPQARTTNIYTSGGNWNSSTSMLSLAGASQYGALLSPGAWGVVVISTPVNSSDNDGLLDRWKSGPPPPDFHAGQPGYYDVKLRQWIPLPGAAHGQRDLFVQLDYMCDSVRADGTCDPAGRSELPVVDAQGHDPLLMLQQVFASRGIALHLMIGNAIQAETCTDNAQQLCKYPNETGVVDWKLGHEILKDWPRNPGACGTGGDCSPRFAYGAKDSYHYVLMGESLGFPAWNTTWGTLTAITVSNGITTINTTDRGIGINMCPSRITISGVLGSPSLNGVYNTTTPCADSKTITISTPSVPNWSYPNSTLAEPIAGVTSGTTTSISGFSDLAGADSDVTLAKWETSPNQDMSKRVNVQVGTLSHEIGHTLGLAHGGAYNDTPGSYRRTFEGNCKPNYQSVMNYMFQLDGLGPNHALDFSGQTLSTLNESQAASTTQLVDVSGAPANYPTSAWYLPWTSTSAASPATRHCDGTPLTGDKAYRVTDPISPISPAWTSGQDLNFNGQLDTSMRGYNDLANIDLRQLGAVTGEFVSLANLLSFGNIGGSLNVSAGGNVTLGSGGTITLGSGGTVTMGSGGSATLSNGGTIVLGAGGNVTLGSGGTVTLGSGGTITMGSGGNVTLGSGGTVTLGSGGTITMGSGGNVTLGSGGTVTLGSGGTILLGSGGTVVLGAGGSYTLDSSGGTIALGSGGNVTLGSGGNVTLGSGGTVTLGSGGNITLGSGGTVALGSGGTITMGSGGTITMGSGGTVVLGSGGTITMGSGGNVTLGSGGNVTLGSGGTVTLGSGGNVALGSGGNVTLGSGGTVTLGSGGNVTLGSGGNVTLGSAGTITLGSGGTVTLGSGGNVTLGSGGTVALGSGGNIILGSGGTVTLGSGGLVTLGSGGTVALGSGGTITLGAGGSYTGSAGDVITVGAGGNITLGSGGTLALGSGGNITLGSGGTVTLGSGGTVTLGSGGNVTLGSGGTIAMGGGGTVTLGSGGNVTLGSGGTVALGSGGNIALGSGGNVTPGSGGTVALGSGGNTILGSGGTVTLGSGGTLALLGGGGTATLQAGVPFQFGKGGTVALGSGGNIALGSGGNTILGSGGTISLGSGGNVTLGSGGTVALGSGGAPALNEITYDTANSIARPPDAPALVRTTIGNSPAVVVNWTPPVFGVVTSYTIYRAENGGTPVAIGTVTGNPPSTTFTDTNPSSAANVAYTISSGVIVILDSGTQATLQSPPSVPVLLRQTIVFGPLPNAKVGDTVPVSATASSNLPVNFSTSGNCALATQTQTSPTTGTVNAAAPGGCVVTASQGGNSTYAAAVSVSQAFSIALASSAKYSQSITFPALGTHKYGDPDFTLLAMASSNLPVTYTPSGNCSVTGSTLHITGAGSCSVTASQAGNGDYNAAPQAGPQSFNITPAPLTITAYNATRLYGQANPQFTATYNGFVNNENMSVLTGTLTCTSAATTSPVSGSPYAINCTGQKSSNYAITYVAGALTITRAPLTITANSATKLLNAALPALSASFSGFVNGESSAVLSGTLSCTTTATASSPVGSYTITCSGLTSSNYAITWVVGTLKILYAAAGLPCGGDVGRTVLQPINPDGTSVWKQGRTIPVKFKVCDANGVSISTPGVVSSFMLTGIWNGTITAVDETVTATNVDTAFRWDGQQWIFNLSTQGLSAGNTYIYTIALNDGTIVTGTTLAGAGNASFQFGLR